MWVPYYPTADEDSPTACQRGTTFAIRVPRNGKGDGCGSHRYFPKLLHLRSVGRVTRIGPVRVSDFKFLKLTTRSCKKHYHMSCLNPPLLAKPAKGYSWVCIPCSLQRHKDVEEQKFHYGTNGAAPSKAHKAKGIENPAASSQRPDTTYRGWPWRYFGWVKVFCAVC